MIYRLLEKKDPLKEMTYVLIHVCVCVCVLHTTCIHMQIHNTGGHCCFWGCPRGVMVKAMDYGIVVREFVLQSRYYVYFRGNTLGKV